MIYSSLEEALEAADIPYWTKGKNISPGWVGVTCIYCSMDSSNHLGLNVKKNLYHCWLCSEKGSLAKFLVDAKVMTYNEARENIKVWEGESDSNWIAPDTSLPPSARGDQKLSLPFPNYFLKDFPKRHLEYLRSRNYDPAELIKQYKLRACTKTAPKQYRNRIIIPYYFEGQCTTWVALDITGHQQIKYRDLDITESIIAPKYTLYNIDRVKRGGRVAIGEGVTDIWRIGPGAVALSTKTFRAEQIELLLDKEVEAALVMLDADAIKEAYELANCLSGIIREVEVVELERGDPDTLSEPDVQLIRKWLDR